ncbi:MAG: 4-alpha-glucanotransferase [Treponema sp.]|nr:4-alpha-glucanotransferase [Treponema sp.]
MKTARDVCAVDLHVFGSEGKSNQIKDFFCRRLKNRTLIELSPDKYVPSWLYQGTKAWQSLNDDEKKRLNDIFAKVNAKNEKLWQAQAEQIFDALIPYTKMIPCGEDLGVNLACLAPTMEKYGILHLNVVRWTRDWSTDGQPYIPFENYCPLDVTTTSVHDSTTIRQWWTEERESARAFEKAFGPKPKVSKSADVLAKEKPMLADGDFSPKVAAFVLEKSAETAGAWFINPLQDWLSLEKKYWQKEEQDERINVPGSVSPFNWTYRMSVPLETLLKDEKLSAKIKEIAKLHDKEKSK